MLSSKEEKPEYIICGGLLFTDWGIVPKYSSLILWDNFGTNLYEKPL